MVYDMQNKEFAVDLDNVHSVLEVGQVLFSDNLRLSIITVFLLFVK